MKSKIKKNPGILLVDPAAGLSGDMFLGCLFALGADPKKVAEAVSSLPGLEPFKIVYGRVKRQGISAVRARVVCADSAGSRDLRKILSMIKRSGLDADIKEKASRIFRVLGEAEGKIHGVPMEKVHFHEVGAVDSIVDIVGAAVALDQLGSPELYHRPFRLGGGMISISHGLLPLPAPATVELLSGRTVTMTGEKGEIVTPTGAAIMKALASELSPTESFLIGRTVYSVGTRESIDGPGRLRIMEAERTAKGASVAVIRTTIDDMNPEIFGYLQERLFNANALDVYLTQVVMKKNRPGTLLTVLCEPEEREKIVSIIFSESSTIGMRISIEQRAELERWKGKVETPYGTIELKCARLPDGTVRVSPEYESCRVAAISSGEPIGAIYESAKACQGLSGKGEKVPVRIGKRVK
ncbi:MAG: nickel pincer cofactor biosynthesis protein LarC [Candidatus Krumholzibacteriota bacterium]|nr:nickel pincer cofactor biosynthesis protein LarC [Candidatus Krumholzibacteriota bacterium]